MRVLHLSPGFPWPPDSGGRIVVWNQLRADAGMAEVGLLSFVESPPDAAALDTLRTACSLVETVRRPRWLDGAAGGVRSLVSSTAMNLARYCWPAFSSALRRVAAEWQPDIVVAHHIHMGGYLLELDGPIPILREHNVDSDLMARYAASLRNPALAAFARRQARLLRRAEERLCPLVARCLAITPDDEVRLKQIAPRAALAVVPGAIDPAEYAPVDPPPADASPLFVTAGSLGFRPTGDGVLDFAERTWPLVRRRSPGARLRVIGSCPPRLRRHLLRQAGVEVTGHVEHLRPHLDGAHAFVVPVRVGGGMRIRILEAMAFGLPVVTTTIGCEGLATVDGRHLLVADSPVEMAAALLDLANGDGASLRAEGRRLVECSYSIDALARATAPIYREAVTGRSGPG